MPASIIAYCGPAAVPDDLWTRWNLDPLLIGILAVLAIVVGRGRSSDARAGWAAIALMFDHLRLAALRAVLGAVFGAGAAPCPADRGRRAASRARVSAAAIRPAAARRAGRGTCGHPVALACAGALRMGPRQRAGLLADAGLAAWKRLADVARDPGAATQPGPALVALAATIGADGPARRADRLRAPAALLGASGEHGDRGDSAPLADQQLAGLLMWVPAMLPYLGVGLWLAWSSLRPSEPAL